MIIETKFSIGDTVHVLRHARVEKVTEACPTCRGAKVITVEGEVFKCPKCSGRGHLIGERHAWYIDRTSTVGQVQATTRTPDEDDPRPFEERYMLHATGIGSGSVYIDSDLWPGTDEEAQAEVDRRNRERVWP
jgi:hypothetical protein